ncbi:PapB/FocB family fimbrial expression transcriptional regulator [Escherichia coli]|uniref:PapB/FocB family fimbrial expression transcriptional regulator n=1 Tax=Escherichia coli TaxID=562 RepID=UPI00157A7711|nr:PapB/FocB family fimbrial expression transcriptional regulator [Escherichia coli]MED9020188.1 PapB/FocB family fimbrial expression transcriptional regulator [Escherichia coli]HBA9649741.1 transcriptional regulator [Escherichia coli]
MKALETRRVSPRLNGRTTSEIRARNMALIPGEISEDFFWLLVELSATHSDKITNALRDHLVFGDTRKVSCERYGASISYFSVALGRLFHVSQIVSQLAPYYCNNNHSV